MGDSMKRKKATPYRDYSVARTCVLAFMTPVPGLTSNRWRVPVKGVRLNTLLKESITNTYFCQVLRSASII